MGSSGVLSPRVWLNEAVKTVFTLLIAIVCLSGCFAASQYEASEQVPEQMKLGTCAPAPCLTLSVSGLPPLPNALLPEAREAIYRDVAAVLYAPYSDVEATAPRTGAALKASLEELFTSSVESKLLDGPIEWQLERLASVAHSDSDYITLDVVSRGYVGGAHGFNERWLMIFQAKNGARVHLDGIVDKRSLSLLSTIAEAELRRVRNVPAAKSLQDAGFFVTAQSPLPLDNCGFIQEGLLIRFNPYDIAPYAMGPTEIVVPQDALKPLMKRVDSQVEANSLGTAALDAVNEGAVEQPQAPVEGGNGVP